MDGAETPLKEVTIKEVTFRFNYFFKNIGTFV